MIDLSSTFYESNDSAGLSDVRYTADHFPTVIDSTMLSSFRACPQQFFRQYVQHWKPVNESVHLVAGGAFAKGLEVARRRYYEQGADAETAMADGLLALFHAYGDYQAPPDSSKSLERMAGAFEFYFSQYPFGADAAIPIKVSDTRSGIEFSFTEELPITHPETGDPIIFAGTCDMIANYAGGIFVFDEKTTTSLGPNWSKKWELRGQFTGYCWAAKRAGVKISGVGVRGISILKQSFQTQQALTYRTDHEINSWYVQTIRDITRMIRCWQDGYWDYNFADSCDSYAGCMFQNTCKSPTPDEWLPVSFKQNVWDPVQHQLVTPQDWEKTWFMGE